jgi:hypothetical protein
MMKNTIFNAVSLPLGISLVANTCILSSANAFEDTNYTCKTEEHIIFTTENNNKQFVYKSFKGNYLSQQEEINPDLVLYDGRRKIISGGQILTWKLGVYTYQIIAPTAKIKDDISGHLIIKKNGQKIKQQQCLSRNSFEKYRECQEWMKRGISDRQIELCGEFAR